MTCVCSLAGTAACKTCWHNPDSTGQFNNFMSWTTTSNYDIQKKNENATIEHYVNHVMDEITKRDVEQVSERIRALGWEEVVRCRDCRHFKKGEEEPPVDWCDWFHDEVTPLGFCAWGTKTDFVTCKCGEDIERIGRIQTCPSCGRKVMA